MQNKILDDSVVPVISHRVPSGPVPLRVLREAYVAAAHRALESRGVPVCAVSVLGVVPAKAGDPLTHFPGVHLIAPSCQPRANLEFVVVSACAAAAEKLYAHYTALASVPVPVPAPDPELRFPQLASDQVHAEHVVRKLEPGARVVGWELEERASASAGRRWGWWHRVWLKPVLWFAGENRHEVAGPRFREVWLYFGEIDTRYSGPNSLAYATREAARDKQRRLHQVLGAL